MTSAAELRIPAQPEYVGLARLVIAQAARQAGVTQDRVQDVKIAVDEALTHAVRAQTDRAVPAPIDVSFGTAGDGFEVVVRGLDPTVPAPEIDTGPVPLDPKLSFTLIEGLTDSTTYAADGSSVCLRFAIGAGDADPPD
ncbi:MAG TPA: ATP-binding protein [Euzebyales bacterium]|nr:ATP-binding protein [Euzebyales bacterium]